VWFTRQAAREACQGELAEIPVFVVLQMLELSRKSGRLAVDGEQGAVQLWLGDGQPLHAQSEKASGMEAVLALIGATRGRFRFEAAPPPPQRTLHTSMTELLLEASRQLDES
jgi:hypothetical protein